MWLSGLDSSASLVFTVAAASRAARRWRRLTSDIIFAFTRWSNGGSGSCSTTGLHDGSADASRNASVRGCGTGDDRKLRELDAAAFFVIKDSDAVVFLTSASTLRNWRSAIAALNITAGVAVLPLVVCEAASSAMGLLAEEVCSAIVREK